MVLPPPLPTHYIAAHDCGGVSWRPTNSDTQRARGAVAGPAEDRGRADEQRDRGQYHTLNIDHDPSAGELDDDAWRRGRKTAS